MPKRPDFNPYQQGDAWLVSVPASMASDGRRHRKSFPTESAAKKYASKMRGLHTSGIRSGMVSQSLALEAIEAVKILDGTGISIIEAARMAAAKAGAAQGEAAETFRERMHRAWIAGEAHWSRRYADDMGKLDRWLPSWFLDRKCGMIDRADIERALMHGNKLSRSTIDTRARYVSSVLNYREKHRKADGVEILTVKQAAKLLRACESSAERRAVALLLFAGVRPDAEQGEIRRLEWEAVRDGQIYLDRETSKVGDRYVKITPRLARLLRGHPESGPVAPANWRRVWRRLRMSAGITAQDVTRHTFASHYLAAYGKDAAKQAMGHTRGSGTILRHYRRAITQEAGMKYFS